MDEMITKKQAIEAMADELDRIDHVPQWIFDRLERAIRKLPSAEEESFEWCTDCKEYDQEAHCCHRWSKMIRKTVEEMQIVHCCECKWFQCNMSPDGYLPKGVDEFECRHWCGSCDPIDFCSYAERREDG